MIFDDDFLKILGAWQKGWKENQNTRLALAMKLRDATLNLPLKFKTVNQACYRKRFLHQGELFEIIMSNEKNEDLTSWTIFKQYAENFKGLLKPDAISAAGREHTNLKNEQLGQNASYSYKKHSCLEVKLSAIHSFVGCFMSERLVCYLI